MGRLKLATGWKWLICLVVLLHLAVACFCWHYAQALEPVKSLLLDPPAAREKVWKGRAGSGVLKNPALVGRSPELIKQQFGPPDHEHEFPIDGPIHEFRIELLNTYPPGDPRSAGVRIKEWQWRFHGFRVAIWFHKVNEQWVVLDTCRWVDGVAF